MKDVETVLEHSTRQNDEEMRSYSEKNWNLALWNGQQTFVSHPFYQQHLWRKLNGNHLKWDTCPWYWRAALVPFFILLYFLVFPFIVLFDIFSCNNDLLFESPAKLKKQEKIGCIFGKKSWFYLIQWESRLPSHITLDLTLLLTSTIVKNSKILWR